MKKERAPLEIASNRLKEKQEFAKLGMMTSLAGLILTGLDMRGRQAKKLHVWSGVGLIGFSIWHHLLYQPDMLERELQAVRQTKM